MFQTFSNHLVQAQQVGSRDTLAIGWVGDDNALLLRLCEIGEVLLLDGYLLAQTSSLNVGSSDGHSVTVDVVAVDMVLEGMLLAVVLVDLVKEFLVKVGPLLEGIFLSVYAGCYATGDESCLYGDGTTSAHRINQVALAVPARQHDDAGSQDLVKRSLYALLTVTATVQTLA